MRKAFTLIEILVVVTIIGVLITAATVSYTSLNKSSRDSRRKADIENIRAAVEQYRSDNDTYPASITFSCASPGNLSNGPTTYLTKIPNDPKCASGQNYSYVPVGNGGVGCDGTTTPCTNYAIGATLENTSSTCGIGLGNYCQGPYGQK